MTGMVRLSIARTVCAALCCLGLVATHASGQVTAPTPDSAAPGQPVAPPLSNDCKTPGLVLRSDRPLAHVANALQKRKTVRILTIGASGIARHDAMRGGYYNDVEAVLEKIIPGLDVQIINRGVSGELAREAGERIKTEVALTTPDLVLWQLGTIDAMAQIPLEDFQQSVSDTLTWLRDHNVDVVLVGLHYIRSLRTDPGYQAIRIGLRRLADAQGFLMIGRYEAMQIVEQTTAQGGASGGSIGGNEFAATESGYACLAEYVTRAVTAGIFARRVPADAPPGAPAGPSPVPPPAPNK